MHRSPPLCVSPDRGSPAVRYGALPRLSAPPRAVTDPAAGPGVEQSSVGDRCFDRWLDSRAR
jgi:hypothetical protein